MQIRLGIILACLIFILDGLKCSQPSSVTDGGGTETVIGAIMHPDGSPASGARVTMIPENYNPVTDAPIPDSMIATANAGGTFLISPVSLGVYNILAVDPARKTQAFRSHITVTEQDTVFLPADTLKQSGAIKVVMADTVDSVNGAVFIKGTPMYTRCAQGITVDGGLFELVMDSIPAAWFEELRYTVVSNPDEPVRLRDNFTVASQDTLVIEAFEYLVVKGSIVYKNGVYAPGVSVQLIPKDHIPLLHSLLHPAMCDTTDMNGVFVVKATQAGVYNIQAMHPGMDLHAFQPQITLNSDTINLSAITVREPGDIKLVMSDTINPGAGYLFIKGTLIHAPVSSGHWLDTGFYAVSLTSVPPATYAALDYSLQSTGTAPVRMTDSLTVFSHRTTLLEAFVTWRHITSSNSGLPSDVVMDMAIDSSGYTWFGTDRGAVSYNGNIWTVYDRHTSGLLSDTIMSITVGADGTRWFGTAHGIAKYDGITWKAYHTGNSSLPNDSVFEIVAGSGGSIWIGTDYGVARFDGNSVWEVYTPDNSPLPHPEVYCIAIDKSGAKWFGTDGGGLARFDGTNWTVYTTANSSLLGDAIFSITIDNSGNTWVGGSGGVALFDGSSWSFYHTGYFMNYAYTVSAIGIDKNNEKWFGTYEGGRIYALRNSKMRCYDTETGPVSPYAFEMFSIVIDRYNNKWVTTTRDGIYVFGPINQGAGNCLPGEQPPDAAIPFNKELHSGTR